MSIINVCAYDWTAKRVITTSNEHKWSTSAPKGLHSTPFSICCATQGAYRDGVKCLHIYSYGVAEYYASQNATPDPVANNNESD